MPNLIAHQRFDNYSNSAINSVIEGCPGKPFYGTDNKTVIGEIVKGERVGETEVKFTVQIHDTY